MCASKPQRRRMSLDVLAVSCRRRTISRHFRHAQRRCSDGLEPVRPFAVRRATTLSLTCIEPVCLPRPGRVFELMIGCGGVEVNQYYVVLAAIMCGLWVSAGSGCRGAVLLAGVRALIHCSRHVEVLPSRQCSYSSRIRWGTQIDSRRRGEQIGCRMPLTVDGWMLKFRVGRGAAAVRYRSADGRQKWVQACAGKERIEGSFNVDERSNGEDD